MERSENISFPLKFESLRDTLNEKLKTDIDRRVYWPIFVAINWNEKREIHELPNQW